MADKEEGEENTAREEGEVNTALQEGEESTGRGNGWEVVSLTESTYAAAPGPREVDLNNEEKTDTYEEQAETSHTLFMSGHFCFPPSQHENLPLEADTGEIHHEHVYKDVLAEIGIEEGGRSSGKEQENLTLGLNVPDDFVGKSFLNEKDNMLSIGGSEFEEGTTLEGLTLGEYNFDGKSIREGSTPYGESTGIPGLIKPSEQDLDNSGEISHSPRSPKEVDVSDLPCGAWWKRRAASLYSHAKEANAFWSIFVAAAVMGLVLLGQRWQHERWQLLHQKWQLSGNDQKTGRIFGPISRLKDVIVGGHPRGSLIRGSSSSEL